MTRTGTSSGTGSFALGWKKIARITVAKSPKPSGYQEKLVIIDVTFGHA